MCFTILSLDYMLIKSNQPFLTSITLTITHLFETTKKLFIKSLDVIKCYGIYVSHLIHFSTPLSIASIFNDWRSCMHYIKKIISIIILLGLTIFLFSACNIISKSGSSSNAESDKNTRENHSKYTDFITVDVFSSQANYQGIQSGWYGKVVKDKFNMRLNIIAPNVAGTGDRLFQTRVAAGNLADIVMINSNNNRLKDIVEAGLLLDLSNYTYLMPNIMQYTRGIETVQNKLNILDKVYAIPSSVSSYSPLTPSESSEPTFGPYIRWDLYQEIGAPKMNTLEDILPVLKKMQINYPKSDSGQKTYAFSLFSDWDDNLMMFAKQPACFYGYDELGFVLNKADGADVISILADNSPYIRSLRFYYQANRMGLLDPESRTQNWDTVWNKYVDGAVLFSPWPWLGQTAYNTIERLNDGKGFMMAPIDDLEILSYGASPQGTNFVVGVSSKTADPERMIAFIDWLYSPEGIMMSTSQTGNSSGPEGLTWHMVDGRPELTDFGITAMLDSGTVMPEEWGGGSWGEGTSQLNFKTVLQKDINPEIGFPYDFTLWDSYKDFTSTPVHKSWQTFMHADSTLEYVQENGLYVVAPGAEYLPPVESAEIATLRAKCKAIIVDTSWQMIYASTDSEFYSLLESMQKKVSALGYEKVLDFDINCAYELNELRTQLIK